MTINYPLGEIDAHGMPLGAQTAKRKTIIRNGSPPPTRGPVPARNRVRS